MKVDQKPNWDAAQPHMRQEWGFVDRMDSFHTLHLDDDAVLDRKIHSIPEFNLFSFINYRQTNLAEHL